MVNGAKAPECSPGNEVQDVGSELAAEADQIEKGQMDRRGLWRIGNVYADSLLDMETVIHRSLSLWRGGIRHLRPFVDFPSQGTRAGRSVVTVFCHRPLPLIP